MILYIAVIEPESILLSYFCVIFFGIRWYPFSEEFVVIFLLFFQFLFYSCQVGKSNMYIADIKAVSWSR